MAEQEVKTIVTTEKVPIKFGIGQLFHPTPAAAKNVFRFVLYTAAVLNIVIISIPQIPESVKVIIAQVSVEATALVHALSQLFGIDVSGITPPPINNNKN